MATIFPYPNVVKELYFYVGGFSGTSHWVYLNTEMDGHILKHAASEGFYINIKKEEYYEDVDILRVPLDDRWIKFNDELLFWMARNGN